MQNKKNLFLVFLIVVVGLFFRFYNYPNRWGLASDQARDAIVAIEALRLHTLPLIGPFSASGPFVFGPYMYWFLMLLGTILPFGFFAFWIGLSFVSVLSVLFMILVGKEIADIRFGLLLGLLTAISPAQIGLSTNLVASSLTGFLTMIAVYCLIRCLKYTRWQNFFFLGLFVSLSMNTHLQAIPLILLLPAAFTSGKLHIKNVLFLLFGFFLPFIPLLIFDLQTHFYESSHLLQFFLFPTSVGTSNRWLTYVGKTWPRFWGLIVGGNPLVGSATIVISFISLMHAAIKKELSLPMLIIACFYLSIFVLLRYFSGRIFGNFTTFLDPFILILVTWTCIRIVRSHRFLGIACISILLLFTLLRSYSLIQTATSNTQKNTQAMVAFFTRNFHHNETFHLYDWKYQTSLISLPLVLYLNQENKIAENGMNLGITNTTQAHGQVIEEDHYLYHEYVFNLQGYSAQEIQTNDWISITPLSIYNSVENWYKK